MKTILAALVLGLGLTAHAETADQMSTITKCTYRQTMPDNGLEVLVQEGGIAGLTQVRVLRSFLAQHVENTYTVKRVPPMKFQLGAPLVYQGQGISLSINYTTAPMENGGHIGSLQTSEGTDELVCYDVVHTN